MIVQEHNQTQQQNTSWLWSDCKLVLRRTNPCDPNQEIYQNLQAEVELESEQIQEPFIPLFTFSKSFQFDTKKGFSWKKGTPLPSLTIQLQKSYLQLLQEDEEIIMIYCELTVAYPHRKEAHHYLEQVRTIGNKKKVFSTDGSVEFNGIIVKESSVHKAKSKFSFLVSICASSIEENKIILKTLISTAFLSESPRIVRKRSNKRYRLTELIPPNKFLKPVCQERSIVEKIPTQTFLQSLKNLNSQKRSNFHNLFYLIYHFNNVLKFYYNSQQINSLGEALEFAPTPKSQKMADVEENPLIKYELKKTKSIKKSCDSISNEQKLKRKFKIQSKVFQCDIQMEKPLLVILNPDLLEIISQEANCKDQSSLLLTRKSLKEEVEKLSNKMNRKKCFFVQFDLMRQRPLEEFWKDIEKNVVFSVYKTYYQKVYTELKDDLEEVEPTIELD